MHNFLDLADFSREQVIELLTLADRLQKKPEPQALAGKILGLLFFNPSLRTLASFQAAMARLGGTSFVISAGQGTWQLETRRGAVMNGAPAEHVPEGARPRCTWRRCAAWTSWCCVPTASHCLRPSWRRQRRRRRPRVARYARRRIARTR